MTRNRRIGNATDWVALNQWQIMQISATLLPCSTGSLTATASDTSESASQHTTPVQMGSSNASIAQFGSLLSRHPKEISQSGPLSPPPLPFGPTVAQLANRPAAPPSTS